MSEFVCVCVWRLMQWDNTFFVSIVPKSLVSSIAWLKSIHTTQSERRVGEDYLCI